MERPHRGSCHCGAVAFECRLDLAKGTSKCNCSMCMKTRFWKAIVKANAFRMLKGAEALGDYQFASHNIHHHFCKICGIKTFGRGHFDPIGDFYAVNVACLDDVSPQELAAAPVKYEDGRHNAWEREPEVKAVL